MQDILDEHVLKEMEDRRLIGNSSFMLRNKCKKIKKYGMIMLGFLLLACTPKQLKLIDSNNPDLTESMKNFFQADADTYVKGEHFQVKILDVSKVFYDAPYYGESYIYRYQIVIAPLYEEMIHIKKFSFSLDQKLVDYYKQEPGYMTFDSFIIPYFEDFEIPVKYDSNEFVAYYFDKALGNMGNARVKNNFSEEEYEKGMSTLYVTIVCSNMEETIPVEYVGQIHTYDRYEDIPEDREDLKALYLDGSCRETAGPYEKEISDD